MEQLRTWRKYTSEYPIEPGWYWLRIPMIDRPMIKYVSTDTGVPMVPILNTVCRADALKGALWGGPIPEPYLETLEADMPKKEGYKSTDHVEGRIQTGDNKNHRAGSKAPSSETKKGITGSPGNYGGGNGGRKSY